MTGCAEETAPALDVRSRIRSEWRKRREVAERRAVAATALFDSVFLLQK